jgi:uncharacterized membrane protein
MSSTRAEGSRASRSAQAARSSRRIQRRCVSPASASRSPRWHGIAVLALLACSSPGATPDAVPDSMPDPAPEAQPDSAPTPGPPATENEPDTALTIDTVQDTFFENSEVVWLEARERGVEFRAAGQEPGWVVEIGSEQLTVLTNYAADTLVADVPVPLVDSTTWTTSYRVRADGVNVRVDIRDEPCADTMSGERFSATVTLELNGTVLHGCGRSLDALPL